MDYSKINTIDSAGEGNIVLQDISGSIVTVNYNDIETLKSVFQSISENQIFEIKKIIGVHNGQIIKEIRFIQDKLAEKNTENKIQEYTTGLKDFFKELAEMKMKAAKDRLLKNYSLLYEYEELLILEDNPKRKMRYQFEIEAIKINILQNENELKTIANQ